MSCVSISEKSLRKPIWVFVDHVFEFLRKASDTHMVADVLLF